VGPGTRRLHACHMQVVAGPARDHMKRERSKRRFRPEEDLPIRHARSARLEIVHEPVAHTRGEWVDGRVPILSSANVNLRPRPVEIVEGERCDLAGAEPIRGQQQQDGVIPFSVWRPPVDDAEHALDVGPRDRARDGRLPIPAAARDRATEIREEDALAMQVAEEDPQRATALLHRARPEGSAAHAWLSQELGEERGCEITDRHADPLQIRLEDSEMMCIQAATMAPEASLVLQVLEEARCRSRKRHGSPGRVADETWEEQPQQLLHG
jgi:hypothetical protein